MASMKKPPYRRHFRSIQAREIPPYIVASCLLSRYQILGSCMFGMTTSVLLISNTGLTHDVYKYARYSLYVLFSYVPLLFSMVQLEWRTGSPPSQPPEATQPSHSPFSSRPAVLEDLSSLNSYLSKPDQPFRETRG